MKRLFTRTGQPLALEVLGYTLCVFAGYLTLTIKGFGNWESYLWMAIIVAGLGAFYRLCVAYTQQVIKFVENLYEKITTFLCRLAGKRGELIPREKTKYGVIGTSLFIPMMMSFYTFPYLLQKSMGCPVGMSYIATIPLAFILFLVDRSFVATMGWKKIWYSVAARVILATVMGLFLSKPIELKLFEKETTEELKFQKQARLIEIEKEHTAALLEFKTQEELEKRELNRAREEYEREVNTSIGGRRAGHGIEARKKEAYYAEQEALYRNEIAPKLQKRHDEIETTFAQKKEEYISTQSDGLGARAQALHAAGKKYPAIAYTSWLILITLIMLDLSPLLAKILMPKSQSDRAEQTEEEDSEHLNDGKNIDRKYALMTKELNGAIGIIQNLDLPQESKDGLIKLQRERSILKYFGEDAAIFSKN